MAATDTTLVRLGGSAVVAQVADALYDRLLADDELGPLFASTHMPTQRVALADYLCAALAGDESGAPDRLRAAHAEQHVTDRHFSIMAGHLADALDELGVDAELAADVLDLVAERRADVVSGSAVAESWDPLDPTT